MNPFSSVRAARLGFGLALVTLAGCSSSQSVALIEVSSPPPPRVGSVPIAAYDDYARAIAPAAVARIETVAQVDAP